MGRHVLKTAVIGATLALALAMLLLPATAGAYFDGGDGKWVPGSVLIKFDTENRAEIQRFADKLGAHLERRLPLIPGGYEIRVAGDLRDAIDRAFALSQEDQRLNAARVEWAQPDYYFHWRYAATPKQPAYWPNDPLFWPYRITTPSPCAGAVLGQAGLWPWYGNLANADGVWNSANPLPSQNRVTIKYSGQVGLSGAASSSIDVLPVWNALSESLPGGNRTTGQTAVLTVDGKQHAFWATADLQRSGIAVLDSGLSNAPDVSKQVEGLISVGREQPASPGEQYSVERYTYVNNNLSVNRYEEIAAIRNELPGVQQHVLDNRPLIPIDDLGSRPGGLEGINGCDGHGTEVASVAAATANNQTGITGVGWNVPLLGIRPGAPVLDSELSAEQTSNLGRLVAESRAARPIEFDDASIIDALGIVKALRVPVLNMSWGAQLFATGIKHHEEHVIVTSPAVVEAMGRVLSDGATLGVAAAGDGKYGVGSKNVGADTRLGDRFAAQLPCALRSLGAYRPRMLVGRGTDPQPFFPGIQWSRVNLLCVTGTYTDSAQLIGGEQGEGAGDSAVDLAAPGVTTVANRPTGPANKPTGTYRLANGTSFAAAMVSGAAALLREVAPGAGAGVIAQALRMGARPNLDLVRHVRYGQLDLACSALWLAQRAAAHPDWKVRVGSDKLEGVYTRHCFRAAVSEYVGTWELPKSDFNENSTTVADGGISQPGQPRRVVGTELPVLAIGQGGVTQALAFQAEALGAESTWNQNQMAFFPIKAGNLFARPALPPARPVYNFQAHRVACPDGSRITGVTLRWQDLIHPQGYVWFAPRAGASSVTFMVALVKPWYVGLLPSSMRVRVGVRCVVDAPDQEP
jgi:hypothetical protein